MPLLLYNFLGYDPITMAERVNQAIIDIKFVNGLLISYAESNIYDHKAVATSLNNAGSVDPH